MLPTRDPPQNKRPPQTESEGLEKNIASKWTGKKKAKVAIITLDKMDFKTKTIKRDTEVHIVISRENPSKRHKRCKHICTQHRSIQIYKQSL